MSDSQSPQPFAQTLRELPTYWRSWSQRTSIEARANALSACADELDAALATQEPTTDHATAHALLTDWRAEDATLPPEAEQMPDAWHCLGCDVYHAPDVALCGCGDGPPKSWIKARERAWFERGWHAALSELEAHGGEWHKWSTPAAAYLAASPPTQEP
jgi:hypothetical protein